MIQTETLPTRTDKEEIIKKMSVDVALREQM